ncbi:Uncharacterised protein [Mycobacteroides abscessus subsp. abscessus]|nr:Uncharacterised protein [Mycobacteroides abscessus subsp. abscessus]SKT75194.1 Uncharacterised protein [Mycobacteroides abscessus subsp. abscessus]
MATTPRATSISTKTPNSGTSMVVTERYTINNMKMIRKIVTMVMLFRLEFATLRVSEASGAAPLT